MFLVDTNVISALAPSARGALGELIDWLDKASPYLFISVITASEIKAGIAKVQREGAITKLQHLIEWWDSVEYLYSERFIPFDLKCAHVAGQMLDDARAYKPGFEDIAIAATARAHNLTVLTRNLRHFSPLGAPALDPFMELPPLP